MFEIVSLFGLLVSAVLIIKTSSENRINIYLSLFFLSISLFSLSRNLVFYANQQFILNLLLPAGIPFFNLSAPLFYLYIRKSMVPDQKINLTRTDLLHFLPSFLMLINILPHLLQSHEVKMLFIQQIIVNQFKFYELKTFLFPIGYNLYFRPILGLVYSVASMMIFIKNRESYIQNDNLNVNSVNISWYLLLIVCMGMNYFFSTVVSIYSSFSNLDLNAQLNVKLIMLVPTFFLMVVNISIFFFPRVIYGMLKRKAVKKDFATHKLIFNDFINAPLRTLLDPMDVENNNIVISRKLGEYFSSKPFLQPGFTLSTITQETNIPYHQLTTYYNNYLGVNFNDWKNNARIDHAMDLIKNGRAKNLTLESIAYSCGFLSRSNFVNSFRKKTGLTPSEFLKSIPQESIVVSMDF